MTLTLSVSSPVAIGTGPAAVAPCARIEMGAADPPSFLIHIIGPSRRPDAYAYTSPLRRASAIAASRARSSAFDGSETRNSMPPTSVTPALTRRSRTSANLVDLPKVYPHAIGDTVADKFWFSPRLPGA
jgi:hypothetical protein